MAAKSRHVGRAANGDWPARTAQRAVLMVYQLTAIINSSTGSLPGDVVEWSVSRDDGWFSRFVDQQQHQQPGDDTWWYISAPAWKRTSAFILNRRHHKWRAVVDDEKREIYSHGIFRYWYVISCYIFIADLILLFIDSLSLTPTTVAGVRRLAASGILSVCLFVRTIKPKRLN